MGRLLLAGLIAVGVIFAIVRLGRTDGNSVDTKELNQPPGNSSIKSKGDPVQIEIMDSANITIECEEPTSIEDKEPNQQQLVFIKRSELVGSNKLGYLEIPDGWIESCGHSSLKSTPGQLPGRARYVFNVSKAADYYLFLRAKWFDNCGDSVYLRLNEGDYLTVSDNEGKITNTSYAWAWHPLIRKGGKLQALSLKEGPNTLEICTKEDGPKLDKIFITTDASKPSREEVNP